MFSKIVAIGAFLAAASASLHGHGQAISSQSIIRHDIPVHQTSRHSAYLSHYSAPITHYSAPTSHYESHDIYARPKYDYSYSVSDPHTGDHKSQHESRDGDRVHGYYTLAQPDGSLRKVEYTAGHEGFNAIVHNSAPSLHPQNYGYSRGHNQWY